MEKNNLMNSLSLLPSVCIITKMVYKSGKVWS